MQYKCCSLVNVIERLQQSEKLKMRGYLSRELGEIGISMIAFIHFCYKYTFIDDLLHAKYCYSR